MSKFNTFDNHPLIPNSNQYYYEKKYVSISSEDRDIIKYPSSSEFEIELPQDYVNVAAAKLYSWAFPANYDVFSINNTNVAMSFKFLNLYNPGQHNFSDPVSEAIFAALYANIDNSYIIIIESGFYNPDQMATELTNKFNEAVTTTINTFLTNNPSYSQAATLFKAYTRFNIVYNNVNQKLWFGNTADQFVITNESELYFTKALGAASCIRTNQLPNASTWGLPAYLGFTRCNAVSQNSQSVFLNTTAIGGIIGQNTIDTTVPRFYYGDVSGTGDNGYWLLPDLPGAIVYFLQAPLKINFMGPAYIFLEIDGLNCIDETSPYNLSKFTVQTNETNSRVNSCFAKIPVPTTPISQWFDDSTAPYKYFNPPAERIRKLKLKVRYHNGQIVDFGTFEYSFMIEFNVLRPQNERTYSARNAFDLGQVQENKLF